MKRSSAIVFFAILCMFALVVPSLTAQAQEKPTPAQSIHVYFSPKGGCQTAIIHEIEAAKESIKVQAYSFTSALIAKALLQAKKRGVGVEVILDKSQETARYSSATFFHNQSIPLLIDDKHAIAHNKIIIIDQKVVITGSFNFSRAAEERNAENLLVIKGFPDLAKKYLTNYQTHRKHSRKYKPRKKGGKDG